jgi:hypothetical protein
MKLFAIFLLLGITASYSVWAEEEYDPTFKVEVHSLDEDIDLTPLDSPYYNKHEGIEEEEPEIADSLPPIRIRDLVYQNIELTNDIKDMDDLDKDMLWRWAKRLSVEELQKKYPNISSEKLKALKEGMHE